MVHDPFSHPWSQICSTTTKKFLATLLLFSSGWSVGGKHFSAWLGWLKTAKLDMDKTPVWVLIIPNLRLHSVLLLALGKPNLIPRQSRVMESILLAGVLNGIPLPSLLPSTGPRPHWCSSSAVIPHPYLYCCPPPTNFPLPLGIRRGPSSPWPMMLTSVGSFPARSFTRASLLGGCSPEPPGELPCCPLTAPSLTPPPLTAVRDLVAAGLQIYCSSLLLCRRKPEETLCRRNLPHRGGFQGTRIFHLELHQDV